MSSSPDWLTDVQRSYDTVAEGYADAIGDGLASHPDARGALAWFAEAMRGVGGPVLDAGCGTGLITGYLRDLGLDVSGIDLSPRMLAIARRDYPTLSFEPGSMTELDVADGFLGGVVAFYSIIHIPDDEIAGVLAGFHRVLRPGGVVLLAFHVGDLSRHKTEGYGGLPMNVYVHRRPVERVAGWLREAGFDVEVQAVTSPDQEVPGGVVIARRPRSV